MKKDTLQNIIEIIQIAAMGVFLVLFLIYFCKYKTLELQLQQPVQPIIHTEYITDSVEVIQWKERTKTLHHYDTMYYNCIDTVIDSIPVQIPIYKYNYDTITPDSVSMQAEITGYNVEFQKLSLQYVREQNTTIQPIVQQKPKRWGLGFHAGFGGGFDVINKQPMLGAYVGIGISYNFLQF